MFDAVVALSLLDHTGSEGEGRIMAMRRLLVPGGKLVVAKWSRQGRRASVSNIISAILPVRRKSVVGENTLLTELKRMLPPTQWRCEFGFPVPGGAVAAFVVMEDEAPTVLSAQTRTTEVAI